MVFFILLALFELLKRKRLIPSLIFLGLATDIKYYAILLLPLIVIYYFKDKDLKTRIIKCIEYGVLFLIVVLIPYLIYVKDMSVFMGLVSQRDRISKGLYLLILVTIKNENIINILKNTSLIVFIGAYFCTNVKLLANKKICFRKEMQKIFLYMLVFLFVLITNFQPWYFIVLSAFMIWQRAQNIKLIIQIQILLLFTNMVFLIYSEKYIYGQYFFVSLVIGVVLCAIYNSKFLKRQRLKVKKILKGQIEWNYYYIHVVHHVAYIA